MEDDDSSGSGDTTQRLRRVSELTKIIAGLVTSAGAIAMASTSVVQFVVFIVALIAIVFFLYLSVGRAA